MQYRFKEAKETEAYVSDAGYVCVTQVDDEIGRKVTLLLTPEQCSWLRDVLGMLAEEARPVFEEDGENA